MLERLGLTEEEREILEKYREPVRERLQIDPAFQALGPKEVARRVLVWHNQTQQNLTLRHLDRLASAQKPAHNRSLLPYTIGLF